MKLKHTKFQIVMEVFGLVLLAAMFLFVILKWNELPDKIPGHYNALGEIDRWGNKSEILFVPIISTILYLSLLIISFFPSIWSLPSYREENKERVYRCTRSLLIFMNVEIVALFFYVTIYQTTLQPLPALFLPVFLTVIFGTLIFFLVRLFKLGKR